MSQTEPTKRPPQRYRFGLGVAAACAVMVLTYAWTEAPRDTFAHGIDAAISTLILGTIIIFCIVAGLIWPDNE